MNEYELEKLASDCVDYGRELAEADIQSMEEMHKEASYYDQNEQVEYVTEEEEKTAAATGEIIADAYWNYMMEKGAYVYGDEDIYIEELQKQAAKAGLLEKAKGYVSRAYQASPKTLVDRTKQGLSELGGGAKRVITGKGKEIGMTGKGFTPGDVRSFGAGEMWSGAKNVAPAAALAAGAGYGVHKMRKKSK